jgi:hypothetical protein
MVVGNGRGLELFSITAGDLVPGSCECAAPPASSVARETEAQTEAEAMPLDPYASIRPVWAPAQPRVVINGLEIPMSDYFQMIARLCSEVAAAGNPLGRA